MQYSIFASLQPARMAAADDRAPPVQALQEPPASSSLPPAPSHDQLIERP
jgi:hypothetical protein